MYETFMVCLWDLHCCVWSDSSLAASVAVIDMQQIFQNSKQVKQINDGLEKQFATQKQSVDNLGKELQENIDKYKKDQAVMDPKAAENFKKYDS